MVKPKDGNLGDQDCYDVPEGLPNQPIPSRRVASVPKHIPEPKPVPNLPQEETSSQG